MLSSHWVGEFDMQNDPIGFRHAFAEAVKGDFDWTDPIWQHVAISSEQLQV